MPGGLLDHVDMTHYNKGALNKGRVVATMLIGQDFSSVPVLDYALTKDPTTRPEFLNQLRNSLINIGFLYLSNPPVSRDDINLVIDHAPKLFTLPQEKKDKLLMRNNPHFLGYTKMGAEYTKGKADQREQYDFATPYECQWTPSAPDYLRYWGPAQVSVINLGWFRSVLTDVI